MALGPGSIAFTGYNADTNDSLAFVVIDAIPAGTTIFFTDNEWTGSAFNGGEGYWSWTAGAGGVAAGAIVTISNIQSTSSISANTGTAARVTTVVGSNSADLSGSGDIVYAYIATTVTSMPTFLTAISTTTLTDFGGVLTGTGLTAGVNAIEFGSSADPLDIGAYNGSRSNQATVAGYVGQINNPANWVTQTGSGNQSIDGTTPDIPFSTTDFTTSGAETQVVSFFSPSLSQAEGDTGTRTFSFTVQRIGGTTGVVSFSGLLTSVQADSADFLGAPVLPIAFSGSIADGQATGTVTIDIAGDVAIELNELFTLTLDTVSSSAAPAVTISLGAQTTATGTIIDDDTPSTPPVINEFVFSHTGADSSEFLEIKGVANTDYSGYRLLVIDGDSGSRGIVDRIVTPGTTDANGYWASAYLTDQFENGTQTLLLVSGATVTIGTDLDANDDGVLDSTPWASLVDAVAVKDADSGDLTYAGTAVLNVAYDGAAFTPGGASRLPDGGDTDSPYDWVRNDFDLFGVPGFTGSPVANEATNTKGAANAYAVAPTVGIFVAPVAIDAAEGGAGSSFVVRLNTAPTADVTIALTGNADVILGAASLTFTTTNWFTPQTVTVSAVDDATYEGIEIVSVATGVASSADVTYNGLDAADISVSILDNEPVPLSAIHDIQGAAHLSPMRNQQVHTTGIVTAIDTSNGGSPGTVGFWIQDPNADANNATSEAIFVFTGTTVGLPAIGDAIDIIGIVRERSPGNDSDNLTTTRLEDATFTVTSSGNALPTATLIGTGGRIAPKTAIYNDAAGNLNNGVGDFDPVNEGIDFFESLEGMRVTVADTTVIGPTNGFGETWVLANRGVGSSVRSPRGGVLAGQGDDNPERIQIQTDNGVLSGASSLSAKVADRLGNVTGIVSYDFGNYEVVVTQAPTVTNGGLRQEKTSLVGTADRLTVAEWNVENLDPSDTKFPELARVFDEHLRRPDIVALQEIQDNNGATNDSVTAATLTAAKLIAAIQARTGMTYQYTDIAPNDGTSGGEPGGNIRVGYLYNPGRVTLVSGSVRALQDTAATPTDAFAGSRKPLAADFQFNNHNITLINVHSSSKGGGTSLYGSSQPSVNGGEAARVAQATEIRAVVDGILTANPNAKLAVMGDFNEFAWNASQQVLTGGPTPVLTDLNTLEAAGERYTYVFDGNSQALDHTLATAALRRVAQYDTVHINAEFTDAVRTSDHDPSVTRLSLASLGVPEAPSFVGGPADVTSTYLMAAGGSVGGGAGADLLIGRAGTGNLVGGAGADLFAFFNGAGVGNVTIDDFVAGTDQLSLQGFAANAVSAAVAGQTFSAGATHIVLLDGTNVTLTGVASLSTSNFV